MALQLQSVATIIDDLLKWKQALYMGIGISVEERRRAAGDAFRVHRDALLIAVADVHILANSLYSKGLISREQLEHAQLLALTPNERKVHLFDAIEARLRSNPEDINTLCDILRSDPLLQTLAEKIYMSSLEVCLHVQ